MTDEKDITTNLDLNEEVAKLLRANDFQQRVAVNRGKRANQAVVSLIHFEGKAIVSERGDGTYDASLPDGKHFIVATQLEFDQRIVQEKDPLVPKPPSQ